MTSARNALIRSTVVLFSLMLWAPVQSVAQPDTALSNGDPVAGSVSGASVYEDWDFFYVDLDSGVGQLAVDLFDLTGDADLFVRHGSKPDQESWDCEATYSGTTSDACVIESPASGRWWIGVTNYAVDSVDYKVKAAWGAPGRSFFTVTPCRVVDTRTESPLSSQVTRIFQVAGTCEIPATATAVALNVTIASPTGLGNLKVWPGGAVPQVSTLNFMAGGNRANSALLSLPDDGSGALSSEAFVAGEGTVHLIIDVVGYFE